MQKDNEKSRAKAILTIKFLLFTASVIPGILSGAMFVKSGTMRWPDFALMFFGVFIAQLGGDYLYYYFTSCHTDPRDSHTKLFAGWKPFFADSWLSGKRTLLAGLFCLAIDAAIGLYFVLAIGWQIAVFVLAGGAIALLFTPLMFIGLKEITVFLAFGPLAMTGMAFVMTGGIVPETVAISIPVGLWVAIVAHLKSARIKSMDEKTGLVTVSTSKYIVLGMTILSFVALIAGVLLKYLPLWSLLGLHALPLLIHVSAKLFKPSSTITDYLRMVITSIFALISGGLFMALGYFM